MRIGAQINPTSYEIDGLRQMVLQNGAALTGGEALPLWLSFLVVAIFAAFGMGLAYTAFRQCIR
jgi:ABC-type multidrug transport system permease subunit